MQKKKSSAQRPGAAGVSAKSAAARAAEHRPPPPFINRLRDAMRPGAAWLPVALALLASLVSLANGFACDDEPQIVKNALLKSLANLPSAFTADAWRFATTDIAGISQSYYRPLFNVWLMTSNALFGASAWGWHLMALLLHAAATAMTFVVVKELFDRRSLALVAATLFAVLPVHAEAVAWVSGSVAVLMALLLLAALYAYLRYRKAGRAHHLALALGFYLLALWSQEAALAFPLVVAYLELTRLGKPPAGAARGSALVKVAAGLALVTAVYALMRYQANGALFAADEARLPLGPSLLTIPLAAVKYLALLAWPFGYSYLHYTVPVASPLSVKFLAPLAGVAALAFVVARYGSRELRFAGAWFVLTLAPALLAINRSDMEHLVQERHLYLPSLGFCLALAVGVEWLMERVAARASFKWSQGRLATALAAALVLFYSTAYILHNRHWSDSLSVYRHAAAVAPDSAAAHSALAIELAGAGLVREAEANARLAVELDPQYIDGYLKLSFLTQQRGSVGGAIAMLERVKSSVEATPTNRTNLATLDLNLGMLYSQRKDYASAINRAQESLALWPRATGYFYAALMKASAKQYDEALSLYGEALRRLPPTFAPIHLSLGDTYAQLDRLEEARDEYQKYLTLAPPDAPDLKGTQDLLKAVNDKIQNPASGTVVNVPPPTSDARRGGQ